MVLVLVVVPLPSQVGFVSGPSQLFLQVSDLLLRLRLHVLQGLYLFSLNRLQTELQIKDRFIACQQFIPEGINQFRR